MSSVNIFKVLCSNMFQKFQREKADLLIFFILLPYSLVQVDKKGLLCILHTVNKTQSHYVIDQINMCKLRSDFISVPLATETILFARAKC